MRSWMKSGLALAAGIAVAAVARAATVETREVYSEAMKTNITCAVVLPEGYDAVKRYPVVYCLHGAGCDYGLCTVPAMRALADEYGFILACPDGRKTSWWYDSPVDPSMRYETFAAKEFVAWVDANYATIPEKCGRALTGTSMGGHGSCWLAMRHKGTFGAVGNVHGGVDVTKWPNNWDIKLRLGERDANRETWQKHTVLDAAKTLKDGELALMTVVGTSDFFLNDNRALHELLTKNEVTHDHIEVRGANGALSSHTFDFFLDVEKRYVFPFFRRFFGGENPARRPRTFMSYNVCECFGNYQVGFGAGDRSAERYTNRFEAVAQIIRAASPEWCALQEVCHDLTNGVDHVSKFAERTGMHIEFADSATAWPGLHQGGGWGVALLSKVPPLKVRRFVAGHSEKYPRSVLAAEFEDYVVYAAHFTFTDPYRLETIADIEAELEKEAKPVFLAGDLNLQPTDKELFERLQRKFTVLTDGTGNTWPAVDPTQRLDYILVDTAHAKDWHKLRAWSLPEKEASDHRPIFLELAPAAVPAKASADVPKKVLMIGNSFSICVLNEMPKVCADLGCKLDLCSMFIGGCSLETHVNNVRNKNPKPYLVTWHYDSVADQNDVPFASALGDFHGEKNHSNICDMLVADTWDVVTLQQASHDSTELHTYHPWGDELVATIRKLAPQAKIVVQETWSYTPWDGRLAGWKIDQDEMYRRLHEAYYGFAAKYGFDVIPVGAAVQAYRKELPVKYAENSLGGDVAGSLAFTKDEATGRWDAKGDPFHLNAQGHFLQALVWTAKLYGADVTKGAYVPKALAETPERARLMRDIAARTVRTAKP